MFKVQVLNNISEKGLSKFSSDKYDLSEAENPQAILLRSHQMSVAEIDKSSLLAIGRAGAGTNNIPVTDCGSGWL